MKKIINNHLNKIKILIAIITIFIVQEMTDSLLFEGKRIGSFFVIYVPIIALIFAFFYFLKKQKESKIYYLFTFSIFPILFFFIWFSFGQKSFKCISGNCLNGTGTGIYISSEQSTISIGSKDTTYNNGHIFGYAFFNNVTWFDKNPIVEIYSGEYKNGRFNGQGKLFKFTCEYDDIYPYDPIKIDGGYIYYGEFDNGWSCYDKPTNDYGHFGEVFARSILEQCGLDSLGYNKYD